MSDPVNPYAAPVLLRANYRTGLMGEASLVLVARVAMN
jgi:hypothetical protein